MSATKLLDVEIDGPEPIRGRIAPGFDAVVDAFAANLAAMELGAGFAVVRHDADGGEQVLVDLHGGYRAPDRQQRWAADTLVNVYSSTKGVTALLIAMLVDRGQLDFDAPVADYWPEFAAAGKEQLTVGQMLSHQGGLAGLRDSVSVEDLCEHHALAARLAAAEPLWPPGTGMGYHPILWGVLAGELVRRVTGRTAGSLVASELAGPMQADVFMGLPLAKHDRCAEIVGPNRPWREVPGITDAPPIEPQSGPFEREAFANPVLRPFKDVCSAAFRVAELPAANGHATALGLARVYSGFLGGVPRLISARGRDRSTRIEVDESVPDQVLVGRRFRRTSAGFTLNLDGDHGPNAGAFGHDGAGGSFGFADPESGVAVGYVMNQMQVHRDFDLRGRRLVEAFFDHLDG